MKGKTFAGAAGALLVLSSFAAAPAAAIAEASPTSASKTAAADAALTAFTRDKPGLAVLVAKDGEIVFERYLGGADLEHGEAVNAATKFHVASVSKQFTAFAVALLAHEGKIDLEADIRDYLTELPDFGKKITVADLVHHTSGLRDQWGLFVMAGANLQDLLTQDAIMAFARNQRALNFEPGSEFEYCNTGYSLAAAIVERVSGASFRQFLNDRVFAPLGMSDTLVYDDAAEIVQGRAMSYRVGEDGEVALSRLNYSNYGATSLHTTPRDLLKWAGELSHPKVFDPALIEAVKTPGALRDGAPIHYAFGLTTVPVAGRNAVSHSGADAGFRSMFATFPDDDATLIVMSNGAADLSKVVEPLADIFLSPRMASAAEGPAASPEALEQLAGVYISERSPALELAVDGGRLKRIPASSAQPAVEAKFTPDGNFYFDSPTSVFVRAENGRDLELRNTFGSQRILLRKTERTAPTAAEMARLEGAYRSEELDTTYQLAVVDGALELSQLRAGPARLTPINKDRYEAPSAFGTVMKVVRNRSGAPTAISITIMGGRVRNVIFTRVD